MNLNKKIIQKEVFLYDKFIIQQKNTDFLKSQPEFSQKKNVIIFCDSWDTKQNLVSIVNEYENLDLIGNARSDSVIYDLAPAPIE